MRNISLNNSISFAKACEKIIPSGSSTLAKSYHRLCFGYSPFYAKNAKGSHFEDIDGNTWLDCEMAMGSVIWGHCHEEIDHAMIEQIRLGIHYSIPGILEFQLAELLLNRYYNYTGAKFFKNGADAVYAAVRTSRYLTGKNMTLACEYHGWLDWSCFGYYQRDPRDLGIIQSVADEHIHCKNDPFQILQNIELFQKKLACVVLCPMNYSQSNLMEIVKSCKDNEILIIFDEVSTGMRHSHTDYDEGLLPWPDFLCLSKGIANGLPLAVILGKENEIQVMGKLKISNAHAGENLALAAAIKSEQLLTQMSIWPSWHSQAMKIMTDIIRKIEKYHLPLKLTGNSGCFQIIYLDNASENEIFRQFFMRYLSHQGIFTKGYILFSDAHTHMEIKNVGKCIENCLEKYAANI